MTIKMIWASVVLGLVLTSAGALAAPPGAADATPSTLSAQQGDPTDQSHSSVSSVPGAGKSDTMTVGNPQTAPVAQQQKRLSRKQQAAMRGCISNCINAGLNGDFCSHSCIPD